MKRLEDPQGKCDDGNIQKTEASCCAESHGILVHGLLHE